MFARCFLPARQRIRLSNEGTKMARLRKINRDAQKLGQTSLECLLKDSNNLTLYLSLIQCSNSNSEMTVCYTNVEQELAEIDFVPR